MLLPAINNFQYYNFKITHIFKLATTVFGRNGMSLSEVGKLKPKLVGQRLARHSTARIALVSEEVYCGARSHVIRSGRWAG